MRSNSITKILKEDRDFSKAELASFPTDSFLEIDKCANKLDYEDAWHNRIHPPSP